MMSSILCFDTSGYHIHIQLSLIEHTQKLQFEGLETSKINQLGRNTDHSTIMTIFDESILCIAQTPPRIHSSD